MNPKLPEKSVLTLSAGPDLGTYETCRPDEFPPYEPVPAPSVRLIADTAALTDPLTLASNFAIWFFCGFVFVHFIGLV